MCDLPEVVLVAPNEKSNVLATLAAVDLGSSGALKPSKPEIAAEVSLGFSGSLYAGGGGYEPTTLVVESKVFGTSLAPKEKLRDG